MPVAGFGLTLLATLVLTKVTKVPSDFKGNARLLRPRHDVPRYAGHAGSIVLLLVYPASSPCSASRRLPCGPSSPSAHCCRSTGKAEPCNHFCCALRSAS